MPSVSPHHEDTALRLEWRFLPAALRDRVQRECGSPVVAAESRNRGFTPGFASVLTCEDGSRHFVKAASLRAQRPFANAYREEARKLAALPRELPAPRLLWSFEDEWVALGLEYVEGRHPRRPWHEDDLHRCLDSLEEVAERVTPVPADLELDPFVDEFAPFVGLWDTVITSWPELGRAADAAALAARYAEVADGTTLVHTDVRDDNVLLDPSGRAWFCDWNWPVVGAPWLDSLLMLIGPRGDGVDVDRVIAGRSLLRDVPAEAVDILIALVTGYFLKSAGDPVPPTSPHIRTHQRWQGEVCWEWLCERRGWA